MAPSVSAPRQGRGTNETVSHVADPPCSLALMMTILLLLGAAMGARAADMAPLVAPLLAARDRGEFGSIAGRAYAEGQRGGDEPRPYPQVSVVILPRSADFEAELDSIKSRYRDSPDAFIEAEPKVRAARLAFERMLVDMGGGPLILDGSSDGAGVFRFPRVPEGEWTLLAWREAPHTKKPVAARRKDTKHYQTPQVVSSTTVVYWRMPVTVKAGEDVAVKLHDRNEWLTGVREDRRIPDAPPLAAPQMPGIPHR